MSLITKIKHRHSWIYILLFCWLLLPQIPAVAEQRFIDDNGDEIQVTETYTRIISLYPAHTENLFKLGLDREIIGVSTSDSFPPQALSKRQFHYREDAEKFLAARPDLVLIRPMISRGYPDLIAQLRNQGITVVSLQPKTIEEMFHYWRLLGMLTGKEQAAEAMIYEFEQEIAAIRQKTSTLSANQRQTVYFEAIHRKMKTFSPQSMAIFALETAGGLNAAADAETVRNTNIAAYGKERILSKAPEIDVFLAQHGRMNPVSIAMIQDEPGFQLIKAVKNGNIHLIEEELVSRPTMRILTGIDEIGRMLYPALFPSHTGSAPHEQKAQTDNE